MARRSRNGATLTAEAVAALVEGALLGPGDAIVSGVATIDGATKDELVFVADARRAAQLESSAAAVVLAPEALAKEVYEQRGGTVIAVADPRHALARVLDRLYPPRRMPSGIQPTATVAADAQVAEDAAVGPGAVIDSRARIGAGTEVGAGSYVGAGVTIGRDCVLYPNVTVYDGTRIGDRVTLHAGVVIGADGFGFARDAAAAQVKIPQVGGVILEDDVEIGANSCVDRGTLGDTVIGAGTKIDNLVQIGHNCRIGKNCAISGLSGLSGSTVLEDGVILGGNVGTAGHQVIGRGTMVAGKSGVLGDVAPGSVVAGYPHMDISSWRRAVAAFANLPEMLRRLRRVERRLGRDDERES